MSIRGGGPEAPDGFRREAVGRGLGTGTIGRRILHLASTASTNDVAFRLAAEGVPEGTVVFAEEQTRGRGRMRRSWESLRSRGLWFSVLLRPEMPPASLAFLPVAAGVAVAETLRATLGLAAGLKWPNDVLIGGRKVAGILVESRSGASGPAPTVLGIGINVHHSPEELPRTGGCGATSLHIEAGADVDRLGLAREILRALDRSYAALRSGDLAPLEEGIRRCLLLLGERVRVTGEGRRTRGVLRDLSPSRGLVLELPDGTKRRFRPEHVTLEVAWGGMRRSRGG